MAITKAHPSIKVEVISQGAPLREYDDDEGETSSATVTKYIEAQSGADFAVHFELQRPFPVHPVKLKLYLDGRPTDSRIVSSVQYAKTESKLSRTLDSVSSKVAEGQRVVQRHCFSKLTVGMVYVRMFAILLMWLPDESHDQPVDEKLVKDMKSMGEISLKVYYIKDLKKVSREVSPNKTSQMKIPGAGAIPEKALKGRALSHQAGLVSRGTAMVTTDLSLGWAHR